MKRFIKVSKYKLVDKRIHDLISEYFDVDDSNGICKVNLTFDKFTDFFDVESAKKPLLKGALTERLNNIFLDIPNVYRLDLVIKIKDYEGYSKEEALEYFKNGTLFNTIKQIKLYHNKKILSLILLILGVITLLAMVLLNTYVFKNSDDIASQIISEVLDIAAWVFVWEAVTIYFLDRSEDKYKWKRFNKRVRNISFE
ncbi:MAG: hypothetical protein IAC58_03060 [Firmicutes bacterium]|uniref:Uncharacterized protein n=1 Tax=Candidatus Onthovivens merdipullorum TaxID=2840889 RepID=A0A9D9DGZ9_9BACL|nr:hypothetical protein [Candidatus Onthovivens merdipullorum]